MMDERDENPKITASNIARTPVECQKENEYLTELLRDALLEIKNLKARLLEYENPKDGYDNSWSWVTKIIFTIAKFGKPLRSAEVILLLQAREPVLQEKRSKEKFISAFLNTAIKHQRLIPYKHKGVRGNYYCLPEWMDDEDQLSEEMRRQIY